MYIYKCSLYASIHPSIHPSIYLVHIIYTYASLCVRIVHSS